jgi:hypothetical protein
MKSSINTFLAGKNPYQSHGGKLRGSAWFNQRIADNDKSTFDGENCFFFIDVLDDGTAITYCPKSDEQLAMRKSRRYNNALF